MYVFPLLFAILVANHLIFMPWPVRLFAFLFVYFYMGIYPVFTIGIPAYYILNLMFNFYHNMQLSSKLTPDQKIALSKPLIPAIRGFLPLSTWKTDSLWTFETLLFLFKYTSTRMLSADEYKTALPPPTPLELKYNNSRLEYEQYCAQLIPGYDILIATGIGKDLKLAYDMYMKDLNYSPVKITQKPIKPVTAPVTTVATVAVATVPVAPSVTPVAPSVTPVAPSVTPVAAVAPSVTPVAAVTPVSVITNPSKVSTSKTPIPIKQPK